MAKRNSKPAADEPVQTSDESLPTDGVPLLAGEAFLVSAPGAQVLAPPSDDLQTAAPAEPPAPAIDPVRIVKIDLPLLQTPATRYAPRTLRELDRRHAKALRALTDGLAHEGAKVAGKPVRDPDQALAWLLDQLV